MRFQKTLRIAKKALLLFCCVLFSLAQAKEQPKNKKKETDPLQVDMKMIAIPVLGKNSVERYFVVKAALEAIDKQRADTLKKRIPRVYSVFYSDLFHLVPIISTEDKMVNHDLIRRRLEFLIDKMGERNSVKKVIIRELGITKKGDE